MRFGGDSKNAGGRDGRARMEELRESDSGPGEAECRRGGSAYRAALDEESDDGPGEGDGDARVLTGRLDSSVARELAALVRVRSAIAGDPLGELESFAARPSRMELPLALPNVRTLRARSSSRSVELLGVETERRGEGDVSGGDTD